MQNTIGYAHAKSITRRAKDALESVKRDLVR